MRFLKFATLFIFILSISSAFAGSDKNSGDPVFIEAIQPIPTTAATFIASQSTLGAFSGATEEWVRRYDGGQEYINEDGAYALAIDADNNVYVTGYSFGGEQYIGGTNYDFLTLKYDSEGNLLWERRYHKRGADMAYYMEIDDDGNIYVGGSTGSSVPTKNYGIIKYDRDGNLLWEQTYNGDFDDYDGMTAMALSEDDYLYVTGWTYINDDETDFATLKINSGGDIEWIKYYDGPIDSLDVPRSLEIDKNGNIWIAGTCYNNSGDKYSIIIQYDPDGNLLSEHVEENASASRLAADENGNVYISGYSDGATNILKYNEDGQLVWKINHELSTIHNLAVDDNGDLIVVGTNNHSSQYHRGYAIFKYDPDGELIWEQYFDAGVHSSSGISVKVDLDNLGNILITGEGGTTSEGQSRKYVTCALNNDGDILWDMKYDGTGEDIRTDYPTAILADDNGSVYVTGKSVSLETGWDYATVKYSYLEIQPLEVKIIIRPVAWQPFDKIKQSSGKINCWIGNLLDGYHVSDIDISSIRLNGTVEPIVDKPKIIAEHEEFEGEVLRVAFKRYDALSSLDSNIPGTYEINITGYLKDGTEFNGSAEIKLPGNERIETTEISIAKPVLYQNRPNPFNPTTEINLTLPVSANVNLAVYNIMGQKVATVFEGHLESGYHTFTWNSGNSASGIYFYRLQAGDYSENRKMLLLK